MSDPVERLREPCTNCNCEGCRDERSEAADEIERLQIYEHDLLVWMEMLDVARGCLIQIRDKGGPFRMKAVEALECVELVREKARAPEAEPLVVADNRALRERLFEAQQKHLEEIGAHRWTDTVLDECRKSRDEGRNIVIALLAHVPMSLSGARERACEWLRALDGEGE